MDIYQRTDYLFLCATLIRLQACTRGQESPESEEALAIWGDTHILDRKALKMVGIQNLNDSERSLIVTETGEAHFSSQILRVCVRMTKNELLCGARSLILQSEYLPRT